MRLGLWLSPLFSDRFLRQCQPPARQFAHGRELDPDTASIVADLPPQIRRDIGVTDRVGSGNPMDRPRRL